MSSRPDSAFKRDGQYPNCLSFLICLSTRMFNTFADENKEWDKTVGTRALIKAIAGAAWRQLIVSSIRMSSPGEGGDPEQKIFIKVLQKSQKDYKVLGIPVFQLCHNYSFMSSFIEPGSRLRGMTKRMKFGKTLGVCGISKKSRLEFLSSRLAS